MSDDEQVNIRDFIRDMKITMETEYADSNPNMDSSQEMDHWRCVLRRPGKQMTTYFSMGLGHSGKRPEAADVLDCLASDAASVEQSRGFEDWATDLGYDPDSRKAEKIYKTIERQTSALKKFLGDEACETLFYKTERL